MADDLAVWLYSDRVALLDQQRGRMRLAYTEEALDRYPLGMPLLSLSLPLRTERSYPGVVRPFLDGLLPEGDSRRVIADDFNLLVGDTFGLIRALGRDCAGALVIQPAEEPAPRVPTTATAAPLSDAEVGDLVANLRDAPLGVDARVRVSLAGVQEKLLLTRMPDGSWGRPVDGTPSTHILKPEIARFPDTVANEAFCMRVAKHLGLSVAGIETTEVSGRKLIVVERYDRVVHPDGSVERTHQEDFCQATGTPPAAKYQEDGGPSLKHIADILQAASAADSIETLLRTVTLNVLVGNGDAHAKNFSILHDASGALRLTPLYDVMCTLVYGDNRLAMYVDTVQRSDRVTADRIVAEATRWGMSKRRTVEVVADILDRAPDAVMARDETDDLPTEIVTVIERQLGNLRNAFERI